MQCWPDPVHPYRQLEKRLKTGGRIATLFMPRHKGATKDDATEMSARNHRWLQKAGFGDIQIHTRIFGATAAVCVITRKDKKARQ